MPNPTTRPTHDHDNPTLTAQGSCSECGTTLTAPVCLNCAQRPDARDVDFYDYDDLAAAGDDWRWG
jgi:hypothetical protein